MYLSKYLSDKQKKKKNLRFKQLIILCLLLHATCAKKILEPLYFHLVQIFFLKIQRHWRHRSADSWFFKVCHSHKIRCTVCTFVRYSGVSPLLRFLPYTKRYVNTTRDHHPLRWFIFKNCQIIIIIMIKINNKTHFHDGRRCRRWRHSWYL